MTGLGVQSNRELLAIDDFGGDGRDDMLWRNIDTGKLYIINNGDVKDVADAGRFYDEHLR